MSTKVRESSPNGLTLPELMEVWQTKAEPSKETKPRKAILVSLVSDYDNWTRDAQRLDGLPAIVHLDAHDHAPPNSWSIYVDWDDGDRTRMDFIPPSDMGYYSPLFKGLTLRIDLR